MKPRCAMALPTRTCDLPSCGKRWSAAKAWGKASSPWSGSKRPRAVSAAGSSGLSYDVLTERPDGTRRPSLASACVRCWGHVTSGQLGYAATNTIGDDETPASAGPVDLGPGRTARALATGSYHSCAVLDDGSVRCWGYGTSGQLGYASTETIGDDETPGSAGPVDLGPGRTARAISAGSVHTCAVLDDGSVRCWGYNRQGQLGYGNEESLGDNEAPGSTDIDWAAALSEQAAQSRQTTQADGLSQDLDDWASALAEQTAAQTPAIVRSHDPAMASTGERSMPARTTASSETTS